MKAVKKIIAHAQESITIDLPEEYRNRKLEIIILDAEEQINIDGQAIEPAPRKYDLSPFYGKLQWKGNAVAEQRKLRDEWD